MSKPLYPRAPKRRWLDIVSQVATVAGGLVTVGFDVYLIATHQK